MPTTISGTTGVSQIQDGIVATADIADDAITNAKVDTVAATKLTGTIADARFPATLPAASAANLTAIPAANITGTLPAISGANLTGLNATNLGSGTVPTARLGSGTASNSVFLRGDGSWQTAGSTSASDLTSGTLPLARLSGITVAKTNVTTEGQVQANTFVTADSSGWVNFGDNEKIRMGAGNDLEVYHDGSQSFIKDTGTGRLAILTSDFQVLNPSDGEYLINAIENGAAKLYYNGGRKLMTTNSGLSIDGRAEFTDGIAIADGSTERQLDITGDSQNHELIRWNNTNSTSNNHTISFFKRNGTTTGSIAHTNNTTSFNTSSDYRMKENVDYTWDATTRLKQLKPARFNFITDADKIVDGFLAHEVSNIVPEAISGEKDAMTTDDDGNAVIEPQGIDQSRLVPLLVKTIQELEARITAGGL